MNDLYAAFEYHDNYLQLLAKHYNYDLKGKGIAQIDKAALAALPVEMRKYVTPLRREYEAVMAAQIAARPVILQTVLNSPVMPGVVL